VPHWFTIKQYLKHLKPILKSVNTLKIKFLSSEPSIDVPTFNDSATGKRAYWNINAQLTG
jgi:hypothetical protein